jgi:hypothetical protein
MAVQRPGPSAPTSTGGSTSTTGPSSSTTTTSGNSSTRENTSYNSTTTVKQQNMTGTALEALDTLIKGLMSGTKEGIAGGLNKATGTWNAAVAGAQQLQSDYSKQAAFKDAQAAVSATMAEGIEQAMPMITAGIDSAGTSGSAMAALLTQQAARDASREAAKLGLQSAVQYGQISVEAGRTLSGLVDQGDPAVKALLEALNISKGAVSNTTETKVGSQSTTSNTKSSSVSTTQDSGSTQSIAPSAPASASKPKAAWEAPASSAVTNNTGSGWKTTYGA